MLAENAAGNRAPDTTDTVQGPDTQNIVQPFDLGLRPFKQVYEDGACYAASHESAYRMHQVRAGTYRHQSR